MRVWEQRANTIGGEVGDQGVLKMRTLHALNGQLLLVRKEYSCPGIEYSMKAITIHDSENSGKMDFSATVEHAR